MSLTYRKAIPVIILTAIIVVFFVNYLKFWDFLIDDTYISMRYARNLVEGHGLVYNQGERVEGYTNFLWVLCLSLFFLSGKFYFSLKTFSLLLGVSIIILTYLVAEKLFRSKLVSLVSALLVSSNLSFVYHIAEGLETALFTALTMLAVYLFILEEESGGQPFSAIPLFLLYLTRPDGLLIIGVFGLARLSWAARDGRIRKSDLIWAGSIVTVITGHIGWRLSYYGQFWPNSYYAKKMGLFYLGIGLSKLKTMNFHMGLFPVLIISTLALIRFKQRFWVVFFWLIVLIRIVFILLSGGSWVGIGGRFFVPAFPLLMIVFMLGVTQAARYLVEMIPVAGKPGRALLIILLLLGVNYQTPKDYRQIFSFVRSYSYSLANAHIRLGKWLAQNAKPGDVVTMQDAGAIAYEAGIRAIDQLGLNDKNIAHLPGRYYYREIADYVFASKPTYIVLLSSNGRIMIPRTKPDTMLSSHQQFREHYSLKKRFPFDRDYHLFLYQRKNS